jgi:hypothetical protein
MITGIDTKEILKFTSEHDNGEIKTIFHLRVLTHKEKGVLLAKGQDPVSTAVDCCALGVSKIENFTTEGNTVEAVTEDVINALPIEIINELNSKIMNTNTLSETEKKTSN